MASIADALHTQRGIHAGTVQVATVASLSPLQVSVGSSILEAYRAGGVPVAVGERVLIPATGPAWILASAEPRPQTGTIAALSGTTATVNAAGKSYYGVPVVSGSPSVGAGVLLLWGETGAAALVTSAVPGAPPPIAGGTDQGGGATITVHATATDCGTARAGSWRSDGAARYRAYQGFYAGADKRPNAGYWFYGDQLRGEGTCTSCTIRMVRADTAGVSAAVPIYISLHAAPSRPGTPPTLGPVVSTPSLARGESGVADLGASVGQALLDGSYSGVGISYSGSDHYACLLGPADDALAGQITLTYTRR